MTIQFDIEGQAALAELVARMEAGEDVVLTRDGEAVAVVAPPSAQRPEGATAIGYLGASWPGHPGRGLH